jgi:hypothetical protein
MRQILYFLMAILVLQMFFPTLGGKLEAVVGHLLTFADSVVTKAAADIPAAL